MHALITGAAGSSVRGPTLPHSDGELIDNRIVRKLSFNGSTEVGTAQTTEGVSRGSVI